MPERLPLPGPSFLREREVRLGDQSLRAGMTRPSALDDGWWVAILWVADVSEVVSFRDAAPRAGPPPGPPLARLGPLLAGGLGGFLLEDGGRQQFRLGLVAQPDDPGHPWACPLAVRLAMRWEPLRAATMPPNELADTVLGAFRRAVEAVYRP